MTLAITREADQSLRNDFLLSHQPTLEERRQRMRRNRLQASWGKDDMKRENDLIDLQEAEKKAKDEIYES